MVKVFSKADDLWQHEANEEIGEKKRQWPHSEDSEECIYSFCCYCWVSGVKRHESGVYFISDQL